MVIQEAAIAGTLESSDIMITLEPGNRGLEIDLTSVVEKQFGNEIRRVISETLLSLGITDVKVTAVDKGALNCVIQARVKAAACRAAGHTTFPWGGGAK